MKKSSLLTWIAIFLCLCPIVVVESHVMGIDFGTEWFKVSMVKKTFDVVLNEASARKSASAIAIQKGDLIVGTEAKNLISKIPKSVYAYSLQLLGRDINDPVIQNTLGHVYFPVETSENGKLQIRYDDDLVFTPEDIVGIIFSYAKEIATKEAGTTVSSAVITIPSYLTQRQRQAIVDSAKLAGVTVLSLLNENTAAAINYGIERKFTENDTYAIFYDMGGSSTTASLVSFKSVVEKKNQTIGSLTVEQTTWDSLLGGREFDFILATHLSKLAKSQMKSDELITPKNNPKAFAKLLKAAQKTKEILSANQQTPVSVESLVGDFDFAAVVTREEFEKMCAHLFERALVPVQQLLEKSGKTVKDISLFEILGGGVRIPKLQHIFMDFLGRSELDKHLNGDEATVLGAAYVAATKSSSFRVTEFKIRDWNPYKAKVTIKSDSGDLDKAAELFNTTSRLGSKKTLSFSTLESFNVNIFYDKSDNLPEGTNELIGSYTVSGIETLEKYNYTGKPKVNCHFRLNQYGVYLLEDVEAEVSVTYTPEPTPEEEEEVEEEKSTETPSSSDDTATPPTDSENKSEEKENTEATGNEEVKEEKEKEVETESASSSTEEKENVKTEKKKKTQEPPKPITRIHRSKLTVVPTFVSGMTKEEFMNSEKLLREIKNREETKKEKEREKNNLESYVYEFKDKLEKEEYIQVSTEEQRTEFLTSLNEAGDWLYEDGRDASSLEYKMKLSALKAVGDKFVTRINENRDRPDSINKFNQAINHTRNQLVNITEKLDVTEEERDKALASLEKAEVWLKEKIDSQNLLKSHEDPVFTTKDLYDKYKELEFESKYLLRRPKKKIPKVDLKNSTSTTNSTKIEVETETIEINEQVEIEQEVEQEIKQEQTEEEQNGNQQTIEEEKKVVL